MDRQASQQKAEDKKQLAGEADVGAAEVAVDSGIEEAGNLNCEWYVI